MYNVFYDTKDGVKQYCQSHMDRETAYRYLAKFKDRYLDERGNGKMFPNGKGFYDVRNPRVKCVG